MNRPKRRMFRFVTDDELEKLNAKWGDVSKLTKAQKRERILEYKRIYEPRWHRANRNKILRRKEAYRKKNGDRIRASKRKWTRNNPERMKSYRIKDADKIKARNMAVSRIPLEGKYCNRCGTIKNLHRHHSDHSKPLEVEILCLSCHNKYKRVSL